MATDSARRLNQRVARAAEEALAERRVVTAIDVLVDIGWLPARAVDRWRQGSVECLERAAAVDAGKLTAAVELLGEWARERGLVPSETAYVARTRDRRALRFTSSADPEIERAYRTHWVSPELSAKEQGGSRSATASPRTWWSSRRSRTGRVRLARVRVTSC